MKVPSLPTNQLILISRSWLEEQRSLFLSVPVIAPFLPLLQSAHEALFVTPNSMESLEDLAGDALAALDDPMDELTRTLFYATKALEHLARTLDALGGELRARRIEALRERLLPLNLLHVNRSYADEAGHVLRLVPTLNTSEIALAKELSLGGVTLWELIERWGAVATQMADLLRQRSVAGAQPSDQPSLQQSRARWIRLVNLILENLDFADAPATTLAALRKPVEDVVRAEAERNTQRVS